MHLSTTIPRPDAFRSGRPRTLLVLLLLAASASWGSGAESAPSPTPEPPAAGADEDEAGTPARPMPEADAAEVGAGVAGHPVAIPVPAGERVGNLPESLPAERVRLPQERVVEDGAEVDDALGGQVRNLPARIDDEGGMVDGGRILRRKRGGLLVEDEEPRDGFEPWIGDPDWISPEEREIRELQQESSKEAQALPEDREEADEAAE